MENTVQAKKKTTRNSPQKIRRLTVTALLAAVSAVLMFLDFSVPLMPGFIKMDVSDFPALIASFALGPVSGVGVCLLKNLINLLTTHTGGVGELSNFILGCMLVVPAGLLYKHKKSRTNALFGAIVGSLCAAFFSLITNYFIVYPIYATIMPMEQILAAYHAIFPKIQTLWQALLIFNVPFTFIKCMLCAGLTFALYKPLSPVLKGK